MLVQAGPVPLKRHGEGLRFKGGPVDRFTSKNSNFNGELGPQEEDVFARILLRLEESKVFALIEADYCA